MDKENSNMQDVILKKVESKIDEYANGEINRDNIDYLYKLVDIHKDLKNEKYWKVKEEKYNDEIQRKLWEL